MAFSKARRLANVMTTSAGIPTASIQDDAITSARVIEKTFRGSDFLYRLELKDKQTVFCYAPSHHNHSLNEVIGVKLDLDHLIVFED